MDNFTVYLNRVRLRVVYKNRSIMMDKGLLNIENPAEVSERLRAAVQGEETKRTKGSKDMTKDRSKHSGLTARQQAFVEAVSKGLTYSDAYRKADRKSVV